ncbi:hypothetical protein FRB99_006775 [Tulasnella sp. 403]|nr:hypothetical protein FRB99_006775 [Tulasnella sp. 403]
MAKSLKAKCKRPLARTKRTDPRSAYAIADSARLARLNARLTTITQQAKPQPPQSSSQKDEEESRDQAMRDVDDAEQGGPERMNWLLFGLLDPDALHSGDGGLLDFLSQPLGDEEAEESAKYTDTHPSSSSADES